VAPLIATALLSAYGSSLPISLYVLACALVTIVAVVLSRETAKVDLTEVTETPERAVRLRP
jgi:hypothetical protein